jgi:hypothetical protein
MLLADQLFWGGTKTIADLALTQDCEGGQDLAGRFAGVSAIDLLEIPLSLLSQDAVIPEARQLPLLMQMIDQIAH